MLLEQPICLPQVAQSVAFMEPTPNYLYTDKIEALRVENCGKNIRLIL
jgi:hypothetical protein